MDYDELAGDPELTPEKLKEKLNEYHAAFRQEFEEATNADPGNVEEYTRDFFKKNIHSAAAQIAWLANNAESESVRLSACKLVVTLATDQSKSDGDPIKDLLNELTAPKAKK